MRPLLVALLLTTCLASVPSASAAPCNGELAIEADCWVDYVQPRINGVVDAAQAAVNDAIDAVQDVLRPIFDKLPDDIPCVTTTGPVCF